jgi:hypothetical protein
LVGCCCYLAGAVEGNFWKEKKIEYIERLRSHFVGKKAKQNTTEQNKHLID